jgi:hypothetical protein
MEFFRASTGNYVNVSAVVRVRITENQQKPIQIELVTGEKIDLDSETGSAILDVVGRSIVEDLAN